MAADRALIEDVRAGLAARANPAKAPDMQRYMKSEMPNYGVQRAGHRAVAAEVFAAHPLATFAAWRDTILALFHGAVFREERYLAIFLAADRRYVAYRTMRALPIYEDLIVTGAWWDYVDHIAGVLLGELLGREHDALATALRTWSSDDHMWKRRAAIVAQVRCKD